MGIFFGVASGALGAYAGWRRARHGTGKHAGSEHNGGTHTGSDSVPRWMNVTTLVLALGLGAVATRVRLDYGDRVLVFLPALIMGFWFVRQLLARRRKQAGGGQKQPDEVSK
jgi:hypothetical protein